MAEYLVVQNESRVSPLGHLHLPGDITLSNQAEHPKVTDTDGYKISEWPFRTYMQTQLGKRHSKEHQIHPTWFDTSSSISDSLQLSWIIRAVRIIIAYTSGNLYH